MATITISREELFELLNTMKPFVKRYSSKKAMSINLEATIQKNNLALSIPNCNMNVKCETYDKGKLGIPFLYFYKLFHSTNKNQLKISVEEDKIKVGQTSFKILT